jgi:diguanylate cyclase (GGDEF)-like protein
LKQDAESQSIPVIVMTAQGDDGDVVQALEAGADDCVARSVSAEVVVARTRLAVQRYQAQAEKRSLVAELKELARIDPLTGILNRRTFFEHFERQLSLAIRHQLPLACVIADLDFFKRINDERGHAVGDATLEAVAELLRGRSRSTDFLCRYGGEEFCILLPHTDERGAGQWAERTRAELAELEISAGDAILRVTASFGVVGRLDDVTCCREMVHLADEALLMAKGSGRDCVVSYAELDDTAALSKLGGQDPRHPLRGVFSRDIMSPVFCLPEDRSLRQAAKLLLEYRINAIPIVNEAGELKGILSEKDLMMASSSAADLSRPIAEEMTTNVVHFGEDAPAQSVLDFFCRNAVRRVVVVKDGHPVGVISRGSLLRWLCNRGGSADARGGEHEREDLSGNTQHAKDSLGELAGTLAEELMQFQAGLDTDGDEFAPTIIDVVSRIQELSTDLLMHCGAAAGRGHGPAHEHQAWLT